MRPIAMLFWPAIASALTVQPHAAALRVQPLSTSPLPRLAVPVALLSTPLQLLPEHYRRVVCVATATEAEADPRVARLRTRLWSVGWLSWWTQTILSVVSGVLLLFASSVMQRPSPALVGGLVLALAGMGTSLMGTYTIVGTLAAKALTQSATVVIGTAAPVQALDLLIVQANTNTLAAHFVGLCASLRLLRAASACEDLIDTE